MAEEKLEVSNKKKEPVVLGSLDTIIVNPNKVLYEEETLKVFLPTKLGKIAVLPEHTPLYTELVEGKIEIEEKSGKTHEEKIEGGIARVKGNKLKILVGF